MFKLSSCKNLCLYVSLADSFENPSSTSIVESTIPGCKSSSSKLSIRLPSPPSLKSNILFKITDPFTKESVNRYEYCGYRLGISFKFSICERQSYKSLAAFVPM